MSTTKESLLKASRVNPPPGVSLGWEGSCVSTRRRLSDRRATGSLCMNVRRPCPLGANTKSSRLAGEGQTKFLTGPGARPRPTPTTLVRCSQSVAPTCILSADVARRINNN